VTIVGKISDEKRSDPSLFIIADAQITEFRSRALRYRKALENARTALERGDMDTVANILRLYTAARPGQYGEAQEDASPKQEAT
jgi:hypothetical protein